MCKLIYGQKPIGNKEIDAKILDTIRLQYKDLEEEKDGASAVIIGTDNKIVRIASLSNYEKVFDFLEDGMPKAKFFGIHTRRGTSGDVSIENCHFFSKDGIHLAHNGIVSAFSEYSSYKYDNFFKKKNKRGGEIEVIDCIDCRFLKGGGVEYCDLHKEDGFAVLGKKGKFVGETEMCDTYQFLHAISENTKKEKLNADALAKAMDEGIFNGIAVLLDLRKDKGLVYTMISSAKASYMVTDEEKYSMIFSYKPTISGSRASVEYGDYDGINYRKKVELIKYELDVKPFEITPGYCYVNSLK